MSKNIDLEKPLSDEDRAWLNEHAQGYLVEANDRQFGAEPEEPEVDDDGGQELKTTGAHKFWEEGTEPKHEFVNRPYDPPLSGHFAPEAEVEAEEEIVGIEDLTVEELKDELRELGESTSGNKDELVKRLKKAQ